MNCHSTWRMTPLGTKIRPCADLWKEDHWLVSCTKRSEKHASQCTRYSNWGLHSSRIVEATAHSQVLFAWKLAWEVLKAKDANFLARWCWEYSSFTSKFCCLGARSSIDNVPKFRRMHSFIITDSNSVSWVSFGGKFAGLLAMESSFALIKQPIATTWEQTQAVHRWLETYRVYDLSVLAGDSSDCLWFELWYGINYPLTNRPWTFNVVPEMHLYLSGSVLCCIFWSPLHKGQARREQLADGWTSEGRFVIVNSVGVNCNHYWKEVALS